MPTPQSNNEELLAAIINGTSVSEVPQSRMEKIWQYALGATVELDIPQSRLEELAIQVAEQVRNGGGGITPTGTISITENGTHNVMQYASADVAVHDVEDALIDGTISGEYSNSRVTTIYQYAFYGRGDITKVHFDAVTSIKGLAFQCYQQHHSQLATAEFPSVASIAGSSFGGCSSLALLNLYSPTRTSIPTLDNVTAFTNTPIAAGTGHVVINDDLVSELSGATNWSSLPSGVIIGHTAAIQQGII